KRRVEARQLMCPRCDTAHVDAFLSPALRDGAARLVHFRNRCGEISAARPRPHMSWSLAVNGTTGAWRRSKPEALRERSGRICGQSRSATSHRLLRYEVIVPRRPRSAAAREVTAL